MRPESDGRLRATGRVSAALVACWLLAPLAIVAHDLTPGQKQSHPVLLRGGDLYTVANGVLPRSDLLFADGVIAAIGHDLDVPAGAEVVDVTGMRVYPGLIAAQTGVGLTEIGAVRASDDRSETGEITPEAAAHVAYNPDSEIIPTLRSNGVTTVQVVPGGTLLRGRPFIAHLDGWTAVDVAVRRLDGLVVSWPQAHASGRTAKAREERGKALRLQRESLRRAFDAAEAYREALDAGSMPRRDLRHEALLPVLRGEQRLYVAADDRAQIVEAVSFAAERRLRLVIVGGADAHIITDLLRERDVPVILGSATGLPGREDDDYDLAYKRARLLHEAGVRFCLAHITRGAWDVRNLPFQAGQAIGAGLPADVALRAITLSVAEILGIDDRLGSLEPGKEATLFVADGDVTDLLGGRPQRMWIRGKPVDLDDRHKSLQRKYAAKPMDPELR